MSFTVRADDHVVPLAELQRQVAAVSATRSQDIADIQRVLALPLAQAELHRASLDPERVKSAVYQLSSEELARLAARARTAEQDIQAGFPLEGIFAIIGIIVVLIIVFAVVVK